MKSNCHRCDRSLEDRTGRPVLLGFKVLASLSLAAVHGGAFLWDEFSNDYCERCRRWISFLSLVLAAIVIVLTALAIRWTLKSGFFDMAIKYWRNII